MQSRTNLTQNVVHIVLYLMQSSLETSINLHVHVNGRNHCGPLSLKLWKILKIKLNCVQVSCGQGEVTKI